MLKALKLKGLATIGLAGLVFMVWSRDSRSQTPPPHPVQPPAQPANVSTQRALLDKYCVTCHNERLLTAGLNLRNINASYVGEEPGQWEKVLLKIRTGQMPPARMPRPDKATSEAFGDWLEKALDRNAELHPNPGRVAFHRLNRIEYGNAIRDLLALEVDTRSLLVGDGVDQHGFDNNAGVLSLSPALLESYISAARKVSRLAVGDPKIVPVFETFRVPAFLTQDDRMSEDLPFGSRGGIAVRYNFPVDGEYAIRVRLRRTLYGYIIGLGRQHELEVRVNDKRIKVFTVGGDAPPSPAPASFSGNIVGSPEWDAYMHDADTHLEVRFPAKAGASTVGVSFLDDATAEPEEIPQPRESGFTLAVDERYDGNPAVDNVAIGGPYQPSGAGETASRRKVFVCHPKQANDERACAAQIFSSLARRAYRRPVAETELQTLLSFYETGKLNGGFESGIQFGLERILSDPKFVIRVEREPENVQSGTVYRLSDFELASRLSFFLWSSIPDDELLRLAEQGKLKDSAVLSSEVSRMLTDPRSRALVDNFASQFVELRKLRIINPDQNLFPDFDDNLRLAMQKETELFFESQMRADRSVVELLTANYTFLNEQLAKHYGIPNVYGSHFRKVTLSTEERGGLLGQGSILALTSYPNRTSPVLRGKWLLDNVLGMPPPPPPPDVPALKDNSAEKPTSVRQRMEEHRKNPACAVCHVRMDPLGFALENYDATGKFRKVSDGLPVDAKAVFIDGSEFEGVAGLRKFVMARRELFVNTLTERLLIYGLGRELEDADFPVVRKIVRDAAASDYRWSAIINGIVKSLPFQMSIVRGTARENKAEKVVQKPVAATLRRVGR